MAFLLFSSAVLPFIRIELRLGLDPATLIPAALATLLPKL